MTKQDHMISCSNCGTQIAEQAIFCHVCGKPRNGSRNSHGSRIMLEQVMMPKTVFYLVMIALAVMGLVVIGLASRGSVILTQTNVVTQMQFATVSFITSATMTATSTVTLASFSTLSGGPSSIWFNQQYCGYPFNPYVCNEGSPVTVTGYLTSDSSCVNLYAGSGQNYVVWNLPKKYADGAYQVYGFVYPNWPQTQPFPPYPFQKTICVGIPMWAIQPYIQNA